MTERTFMAVDRHGNKVEFELIEPRLNEENEGEREYRIAYSRCILEGVFPKERLREAMSELGMWTEDDDRKFKVVIGKISLLQVKLLKLEADGDKKACISVAKELIASRQRMWELFLVQQSVFMNSAEGVSEAIKTEVIMAACTFVKGTNKRYWENYSEYVRERDMNIESTVYNKVVHLQSDILNRARLSLNEENPEHKYIKDISDFMIDEAVEAEVIKEVKSRVSVARKKSKRTTKKKVTRGKKVAGKTNTAE